MTLLTRQVPLFFGHSSKPGAGTANRTRVSCLPCTGSATELCQRSWRGDSNAALGLTRPALFPLSYTSETLEAAGRIALPMICFAGRRLAVLATPPQKLGAEYGNCTRVSGLAIRGTAPIRTPRWSEQRETGPRFVTRTPGLEVRGTSRCTMLAFLKPWRSQRELNPSLLIDSQVSFR
jgi:hypothetical protein